MMALLTDAGGISTHLGVKRKGTADQADSELFFDDGSSGRADEP